MSSYRTLSTCHSEPIGKEGEGRIPEKGGRKGREKRRGGERPFHLLTTTGRARHLRGRKGTKEKKERGGLDAHLISPLLPQFQYYSFPKGEKRRGENLNPSYLPPEEKKP